MANLPQRQRGWHGGEISAPPGRRRFMVSWPKLAVSRRVLALGVGTSLALFVMNDAKQQLNAQVRK